MTTKEAKTAQLVKDWKAATDVDAALNVSQQLTEMGYAADEVLAMLGYRLSRPVSN